MGCGSLGALLRSPGHISNNPAFMTFVYAIQIVKDLFADGYQPAASIVEACKFAVNPYVMLLSIPADYALRHPSLNAMSSNGGKSFAFGNFFRSVSSVLISGKVLVFNPRSSA